MLDSEKVPGDLVAAPRPTEDSLYVEGTVKKVYVEDGEFFYEIAWHDGLHFGEIFYEKELEEIDTLESEALIRVGLSEFLSEEDLDDWFESPNGALAGLTPYDALEKMGFQRTVEVALEDYGMALRRETAAESADSELEAQMGALFGH